MNERIRELEKQATDYYSNGQERIFDRQKFAELIVRECADVVDIDAILAHRVRSKMFDHFGVDE